MKSNLKEMIKDQIESGEITSDDGVIELLNNYAESFGLDNDEPIIDDAWKWFAQNQASLLK